MSEIPLPTTSLEAIELGFVPVHVESVKVGRNSANGNIRRRVVGHTVYGGKWVATTATDSSAGFAAANLREGRVAWFHRNGRGTIDYVVTDDLGSACSAVAFH